MRKAVTALLLVSLMPLSLFSVGYSNAYRSPRNPERKIRSSTSLIVLHTTEAPARSSLNKVSDRGECHFCVTEDGSVYRIVDRDREAFHAGRSMWNGREDVDKFSVGIECVGYHNKAMPNAQIAAIRDLVKELQAMYSIPDERVVCHSHVAYGAPNKWHRFRHRGRKRCGMLFAMASVRAKLGLRSRPAFDPDTRARRLRNADDYLVTVLYGRVDTMARVYGRPAAPAGRPPQPAHKPAPAKPAAAKTSPAKSAPGSAQAKRTVSAVPKKGKVPHSVAELKQQGYVNRGTISKTTSALKIAGPKWNSPDTYYVIRGKVTPGNAVNASKLENGMSVWRRSR